MTQISAEVERLNNLIRSKVEEINTMQTRYRELVAEHEMTVRRLNEAGDINRKVPELESRVVLLSQEIERLNTALRGKVAAAPSS